MASLIPLPGNALGGIANLVKKRRGIAGSVFGKAANTQPQGPPTNPLSQAATSSPQVGAATIGGPQVSDAARGATAGKSVVPQQSETGQAGTSSFQPRRTGIGKQVEVSPGRFFTPRGDSGTTTPAPADNSGLAARLGAESIARSRKKNKEQQSALSSQAIK